LPTAVCDKPRSARLVRHWNDPTDNIINLASSSDTRDFINRLGRLQESNSTSSETTRRPQRETLAEALYDARAKAKEYTATTLHTAKEWRDGLFRQLDLLLDVDEWAEGDLVLAQPSFATFIRVMFALRPHVRPGLGISADGHLIASWTCGRDRLTLECRAEDKIRWVVSQTIDEEVERAAGTTTVSRLAEVLQPYPISVWLRHGSTERS
jgi:hypothetical protein